MLGRVIKSYPTIFGIVIGLLLGSIVLIIVIWFPKTTSAWDRNDAAVRSGWCTFAFFVYAICRYWRLRGRPFFWLSIVAFFVAHTLGVVYFSKQVHALSFGNWLLILGVETFSLLAYFGWLDRKYRHAHRHIPGSNPRDDEKMTVIG